MSAKGHVRKRACASLISDVYIQEVTRMLPVSRCWVSDHAAIASKSQDTKAAPLDEVGRPEHGRTIPLPDPNQAEIPHCGKP